MKMYVANITDQYNEFRYYIPEQQRQRCVTISPHCQQALPDDMTQEQIDHIVSKFVHFAFFHASDITSRTRHPACLLYSIDRPVPDRPVEIQIIANDRAREEEGKLFRKQAAISAGVNAAEVIDELTRNTELSGLQVKAVTTLLQETENKDGSYSDPNNPINESYKIDQPSRFRRRRK